MAATRTWAIVWTVWGLTPVLALSCHRPLPLPGESSATSDGGERRGRPGDHGNADSGSTDAPSVSVSDASADRTPPPPADAACDLPPIVTSPCGGCGNPACAIPYTLLTCSDGMDCAAAVCAPGFANCDLSSPDCETWIGSATAASNDCMPEYLGTRAIADGSLRDSATAMAPDGSFFVGGTFLGTVDFDPTGGRDVRTAGGDTDGYITKLNADGSYAWTATLVGNGNMTLGALAATPSGGVVATGDYGNSIDLDPGPGTDLHRTNGANHLDPYVVQLAADGSWTWSATFTADFNQPGGSSAGLALGATGAVYVAGSFSGSINFDPGGGTHSFFAPTPAAFLIKLAANGELGWAHAFFNGSCASSLAAVAVSTEGNIWATGTAQTGEACTILRRPGRTPQDDALIVKLTPVGGTLAIWTLGDVGRDTGVAIAPGAGGSMYIGGRAAGTVSFDPLGSPVPRWIDPRSTSSFVVKVQMSGRELWARPLNGVALTALAATTDGGVLAAGTGAPSLVARLTGGGDAVWTTTVGGAGTDALSLAAAGDRFVVAGHSSGSNDFDPSNGVDEIDGSLSFVSLFTDAMLRP